MNEQIVANELLLSNKKNENNCLFYVIYTFNKKESSE